MNWNALHLAVKIAQVALPLINPSLAPIAGIAGHAIAEAQAMVDASGAEKAAHVQKIVNDATTAINTAAGRDLVDVAAINESLQEGIDTTVAMIKVFDKKS